MEIQSKDLPMDLSPSKSPLPSAFFPALVHQRNALPFLDATSLLMRSVSVSSPTGGLALSSASSASSASPLSASLVRRARTKTMLPCGICGKAFDRPSLLKRHMRTHTGEKPHVCDVCNKGFSTSSSLNTHKRIHSGEKPHECTICGKRFTASSNLYYHKMTHNKDKPHKCSVCEKSFPTPGDLKAHAFVHNGVWPFRCHICNRGFSKPNNARNHLIAHLSGLNCGPPSMDSESSPSASLLAPIPSSDQSTSASVSEAVEVAPAVLLRSPSPPAQPPPPSEPALPTHQQPLVCPMCPLTLSDVSLMQMHVRSHLLMYPSLLALSSLGLGTSAMAGRL